MISPSASVYSCVSVTTSAAHQTPGGPGTRGTDSWLDDTDKKLIPIYLYCLNCTKFGQLILQKIIKIVATRCQILRLKCTKFDFVWGSAPDFAGVAYSAPPDLLAGFNGPTSKVRGKGGEGRERRGKEGQKEGTGRGRVRVHTGTSFFPLPALQLGLSQYYYTVSDCHLRISIDRSP